MLALSKKSYNQHRQYIKKQRYYFANKGPSSQSCGFSVVIYSCESWTIKRLSTKELMLLNCGVGEDSWDSTPNSPWTARRSNQSILKEISPKYSLEGLMLKLKLRYLDHLMRRTDSFENFLMLGKIVGKRRRGWQRIRWLNGITNSMDVSLSKSLGVGDGQGILAYCSPWGCKELDTTEPLNWTELNNCGSRWRNCWLKKSGLKIERFLWWESWRPEVTVFDKVEKGARLHRNLQQGAGNLNIKRLWLIKDNQISCIKEFDVWEDASIQAYWNHLFYMHLIYQGPYLFWSSHP